MKAAWPGALPVAAALAGPRSERAYQAVLTGALAALGFFLLFSSAGTSLALFALLVLCFLAPRRIAALAPWRLPAFGAGLLLLAWIAVRTVAGAGWTRGSAGAVNRYHELLMLPLLWALLRLARRPQALAAGLAAGALVFAVIHWLAAVLPWANEFMATRRISGGFGLAVCAFLAFEHARLGRVPRGAGYAFAAFLATTVLFAGDSRTGHLVLLLLAGCAAWRTAPGRWRLPAMAAVVLAALLAAAFSQPVRERLAETLGAVEASRAGQVADNSSGARIELLQSSLEVARRHWLLGTGWQGYGAAFADVASARGMTTRPDLGARSENPHNEYLMQLGAGGLPALALFLLWLAAPLRRAGSGAASAPWAGALGCVVLAFAVGCLFNSLLLDFVEGHFYGAVLAWLLALDAKD